LFLYCYESQFKAKLREDHSKHLMVSLVSNNYRFLENILRVGNPNFFRLSKQKNKVNIGLFMSIFGFKHI